MGYNFALTNDVNRYVKSRTKENYTIDYAPGYDASFFTKNVPEFLIGDNLANMFRVKAGDTVTLLNWHRYDVTRHKILELLQVKE